MSEITRESHYVPQATLRRWSEDGVNVHAYRLLVSHQNVPEWQPHALRGLPRVLRTDNLDPVRKPDDTNILQERS